jgi:hypothetical protein
MEPIMIACVVFTCVFFLYKFLESLVRRRERIMLVEKIDSLDPSHVEALQKGMNSQSLASFAGRFTSLRFGMLLAGIGLGLIVAWVLTMMLYPNIASFKGTDGYSYYRDMFSVIYLAAPACFGGLALLLSYLVENKSNKPRA